ncbi:MAG: hypothetical protein AAF483_18265, partial [Planctomycetota bacterium]
MQFPKILVLECAELGFYESCVAYAARRTRIAIAESAVKSAWPLLYSLPAKRFLQPIQRSQCVFFGLRTRRTIRR